MRPGGSIPGTSFTRNPHSKQQIRAAEAGCMTFRTYFPIADGERLEALCALHGISKSDMLLRAFKYYVNQANKPAKS